MTINAMPPDACSHGEHHCHPPEGELKSCRYKSSLQGDEPMNSHSQESTDCELKRSQQDTVSAMSHPHGVRN